MSTHGLRLLILHMLLFIAALSLAGCEDTVYTSGEVAAKQKYQSVKKGEARDAVIKNLGAPAFELVWNKTQMKYDVVDQAGKELQIDLSKELPATTPAELRFLPKKAVHPRILVYSAGTVFGYIGLNDQNVVTSVDVVVS